MSSTLTETRRPDRVSASAVSDADKPRTAASTSGTPIVSSSSPSLTIRVPTVSSWTLIEIGGNASGTDVLASFWADEPPCDLACGGAAPSSKRP